MAAQVAAADVAVLLLLKAAVARPLKGVAAPAPVRLPADVVVRVADVERRRPKAEAELRLRLQSHPKNLPTVFTRLTAVIEASPLR